MKNKDTIKIIALLFLLIVLMSLFVKYRNFSALDALIPEETPNPSIYNTKLSGLSEFYKVLNEVNLKPKIWTQDLADINKIDGLLIFYGNKNKLDATELVLLTNWIKNGNILIWFDDFSNEEPYRSFYKSFNLKVRSSLIKYKVNFNYQANVPLSHKYTVIDNNFVNFNLKDNDIKTFNSILSTNAWEYVKNLSFETYSFLYEFNRINSPFESFIWDFIRIYKVNQGGLILINDSSFINNTTLIDNRCFDNFQFILNILKQTNKSIYFYEPKRNTTIYNSNSVYSYMLKGNNKLITIQLFFIFMIFMLSRMQRFGKIRPLANQRVLSQTEYMENMALFLQSKKLNFYAFETILKAFLISLRNHFQLKYDISLNEILLDSNIQKNQELIALLNNLNSLNEKNQLASTELITIVNKMDQTILNLGIK